jgi:hypothetical protein
MTLTVLASFSAYIALGSGLELKRFHDDDSHDSLLEGKEKCRITHESELMKKKHESRI